MIPNSKEEYMSLMGLASEDIGSRQLLLKKITKRFKGVYKISSFHKLRKNQLKAIFYESPTKKEISQKNDDKRGNKEALSNFPV